MFVYRIVNMINGKCYVGKTTQSLECRIERHLDGKGSQLVSQAINKYGRDNFRSEILEELLTIEELNLREMFWIKHYDSVSPNGYNLTVGGDGGDTWTLLPIERRLEIIQKNRERLVTPETRLKMRLSSPWLGIGFFAGKTHTEEAKRRQGENRRGSKNGMFNKNHTPETCEKIRAKAQGRPNPNKGKTWDEISDNAEEIRKKISENHADVSGDKNPFYNKSHSEEQREKWSRERKGRPWSKARREAYNKKHKKENLE